MNEQEEKYELAQWLAGELSAEELAAFERKPEYKTYAQIATYSAQLEAPEMDADALYASIKQQVQKEPKIRFLEKYKVLLVAASLVLFLGIGLLIQANHLEEQVAEVGQFKKFELPDQSEVVLNAGSTIMYKKWGWSNNRQLELEGEAYFKVQKGQKFTVSTSAGTVQVLGTQFNVKVRNGRFETTCFEGRVRVQSGKNECVITKGQSVIVARNQFMPLTHAMNDPQWVHHEVGFHQEHLNNVLQELARQYPIQFKCKTALSDKLFSGTLPTNDLPTAMRILASTYHFTYQMNPDKSLIVISLEK
ncbi:MAG: iron dicitrate transport regulator FecR [Flavobacterium sp. BFFFF2]|nr:MAG: iron dicitrate transport regulator FecR [Flavobacterium sp. BFFFF2]